MFENGAAFTVVFGGFGLLFPAVGVGVGAALIRRMRWRTQALAHGLAAEARCLETYVTQHRSSASGSGQVGHSSTVRHMILGFRTQDGRDIRIDDTSGVPHVVGDIVPVRYLPEHPQRAVVDEAIPTGATIGLVLSLLFCVVFTCFGLFFAVTAFAIG